MTYQETVQWMFGKLPMYQREGRQAFRNKLDNSIAFSAHLKQPEKQFRSVHVAGTNGKGSVSHMLASVLQEAGYKTGLYTSPHLKDFRERIRINGEKVSRDFVVEFIEKHRDFLEAHQLSFFEMTVGMAFAYFAETKVDMAVIETGLGGRLDSTTIITPEVSVITNISYDHTDMLGRTLAKIAYEKAGIIKPGIPVVIGEYQPETFPVFETVAEQRNAPLTVAEHTVDENYLTDLQGDYQARNIKSVVAALRQLKEVSISEDHVKKGLGKVVQNTGLQGRWQQLQEKPKVICDIAHNEAGLAMVFRQVEREAFTHLHIVFGIVKEKKLREVFKVLPRQATYYFCRPDVPRGLPAVQLQEEAQAAGFQGEVYGSVSEAYEAALRAAAPEDLIYIGGSAFVVAEVV